MPTLHLPAAHTDTDVALATEVALVVGSHELFVTWTHGEGPGLPPGPSSPYWNSPQQISEKWDDSAESGIDFGPTLGRLVDGMGGTTAVQVLT